MLDDRHYMRPDYQPQGAFGLRLPLTILLMISLVIAFALQQINAVYGHPAIVGYLALSADGLRHGYVWQLLTFQFLHFNLTHLLFNLIGVWFFGKFVEERLGRANFLKLYFLGGVAGGLLQSSLGWLLPRFFGFPTMGASAGIFALIAAFALAEPDGLILLFFVLPLRAKYLLYIETGVALFFTLVPSDMGVAHAAHLGGIIFAVAYIADC